VEGYQIEIVEQIEEKVYWLNSLLGKSKRQEIPNETPIS
jgi:hypothetical protein